MAPQPIATEAAQDLDIEGFAEAWNEFFGAVRRVRGRAARDSRLGELTLAQFQLIAGFGDTPEMTVGEVALAGGVAPPTATRMLLGLERDGIVERTPAADDKRRVIVSLTAKGRDLLETKRRLIAEKQRVVFSQLDETEREQAEHILHRLAEALEEL